MTKATNLIDAKRLAAYKRDGYVVVPGLITDEELDYYEPLVTAAVAKRTALDTRPLSERSLYEQSFSQCMNLWEDFETVRPLSFHPRIGHAAAELVGCDAIRMWHDQALYKPARGRETDPHQDQPYWPIRETDTITAWISFQGSTLANGAMAYLPGSHLVGVKKFVNIFQAGDPGVLMNEPEIKAIEPVWVEVPRGSIAFHSGLTVHMAKPNTTDADRAVHTVIMFADGCTRGNGNRHPSVDRDAIEVGAVIRGSCTPVIWPRPEGDLPGPGTPLPDAIRQIVPAGVMPE